MKLAPSLHRIGSDLVDSYLVEDASGVTVIDAGLAGNYRDLRTELTAIVGLYVEPKPLLDAALCRRLFQ